MKKVLLVEDEEKIATALGYALEEEGYEVIYARDGESGLEMAKSALPGVILLDIMLPKMDGFEVCRSLKSDEQYKSIPIIMMTGLGDTQNTVKGLSAGADDYVSKPFNLPELLARVKSHLKMKELYDIVKEEEEEKSALLDMSQSLSSVIDPHKTLYIIVSKIAEIIEVKRCSIIYVDPKKNEGYVMASHDSSEIIRLKIDLEKYPEIQKVLETGEQVIINDVYNDPILFSVREVLNLIDIKSIMAFPIAFKDALIGTLILRTSRRETPFNDREIRFCEVISHLASAPLKNAYLFEILQMEKEQERNSRLAAEDQLEKFSYAMEQSPNIVVITKTCGDIEYVNPKFTEITGYSPEEAIGQNPRILKSGKTPPEEYKRLWDAITSGREWRGEFCNKKKNGELYWELATISPIKNKRGEITHFIATKEDITDLKETEKELREKTARLEEFHEFTVGRELRMVELKNEVNKLLEEQGMPEKYHEPDKINGGR